MNQLNHTLLVSDTELYIFKHAFVQRPKLVNSSVWEMVVTTCVTPNCVYG